MDKIRVLVADDHPLAREGLRRYLADKQDIVVVASSGDGEETVRLAQEFKPDVAIIDVAMPRLNGIEAAKQIKQTCPLTAILMVSAYNYEAYVLASLRAGAAGYMLKSTPLRELINAVRMVHLGESVFDLRTSKNILRRLTRGTSQVGFTDLSSRELEILKAAAKGTSNKEIAAELAISERTVQTHLKNIFQKLRVGSRTEAVLCALKRGWLTLDDLPE